MIRYECDKCGKSLAANDRQRYIVKMEIFAAADHVDLDVEAVADPKLEMAKVLSQLAAADPDEIEDQTYRAFRYDLCDDCRRTFLRNPLG
ncbi:MAG: hypothetical protein JSU63_16670 [Phycisphaerales bacterium]|nr:MAG: hypothetical protein JSU63_16670 [Phycisphaerales bacterium]